MMLYDGVWGKRGGDCVYNCEFKLVRGELKLPNGQQALLAKSAGLRVMVMLARNRSTAAESIRCIDIMYGIAL